MRKRPPTPSSAQSNQRAPATGRVDAALRTAIRQLANQSIGPGARVLVGVSGGQDSLCLVHALWRLRSEHAWHLHVVTVDHGIRPEAAREAEMVAALAGDWGLPCDVVRVDVPSYRRRERLNLQAAARYARYQCFARQANRLGAAGVAVGHTADDIAETLLLHLLRGAGLDGLAAAPLVHVLPRAAWGPSLGDGELPPSLPVVRPLLAVSRGDTAAYCAEQGLQPVGEQAGHYHRDRVRHDLLPALEQYNPAVRRALAEAAFALGEERAALDQWTTSLWREHGGREGGALSIPLEEWRRLPPAMRKRLVRRMTVELAGPAGDLGRRSLAAVVALAGGQAGRGIDLPGGLRLERTPTHLCLGPRVRDLDLLPGPWPLPVPGEVTLPGVGTLRVERCGPVVLPEVPATGRACPNEAWLDADSVRLPLWVRWRRSGDRLQPLGMDRAKRLQDFLVDCRVPRARRDSLPLVVAGEASEEIVWVVGVRIAHPARLRPSTRDALHLTFEPAASNEDGAGA